MRVLVGLLLLVAVLSSAWVCDDAYISFRTLDNLLHGYGLRWNVDERVQSFTHPLWLLLHAPFAALTGEVFFTTLALSLLCTLGAFGVATRLLRGRPAWCVAAATLPLLLSRAFLDFATSGLENPLSYLLLALFGTELLLRREPSPLRLTLLASLAAVNRPDAVLLLGPALALEALRWRRRALLQCALGLLPLLAWELFSLLYYGFPFPNTRYAKLPSNSVLSWQLQHGSAYLASLLLRDPVSALWIVAGLVAGALGGPRARALAAGLAAYGAYVVWIGGDFMQGRFFAAPTLQGALLLWSRIPQRPQLRWPPPRAAAWVAAALLLTLLFRTLGASGGWLRDDEGIEDERVFYERTNSLAARLRGRRVGLHLWAAQGARARQRAERLQRQGGEERLVVAVQSVGIMGYHAGPEVFVLDQMALGDALLARLPVWRPLEMRPGHPRRQVPEGYREALETGSLEQMDPNLARYYGALRRIVRAPVFDRERLATLWRFHRGHYQPALDAYLAGRSRRGPRAMRRQGAP